MSFNNKYLILDEERNAYDYFEKSGKFLAKIDSDRLYLKWFTIAFHGAIYHFILLFLQNIDPVSIFKDNKNNKHPLERQLLSFKKAYLLFKDAGYTPKSSQDASINELNDALRNQMLHFRPTIWASEPWYFANVCYPLLEVLEYCINNRRFINLDKKKIHLELRDLRSLLKSYTDFS